MKEIQFCKVTILAIAFLTSNIKGSVIRFAAYPSVIKTNLTSSASMRCSLANTQLSPNHNIGRRSVTNTTDDIFHISGISVTNSNGNDVASISPFDAATAYVDAGNLQVKGDVTGSSTEGYLELSWRDASAMALGEYFCEITAVNKHHHPIVFQSSLELTEKAPTVDDVIHELKALKQQSEMEIASLKQDQTQSQNEISSLKQDQILSQNEITSLKQNQTQSQNEITNLKHDQTTLKNCASKRSGFTAVISSGFSNYQKTFTAGQTIIFEKIIYSTGSEYDNKTGVFTCNEAGIYSFSVTALSFGAKDVRLNLRLNSDIITSAYAYDISYVNTAATNALLHLQKGDTVRVTSDNYGSSDFYQWSSDQHYQGNVFVGQMVQSDCVRSAV